MRKRMDKLSIGLREVGCPYDRNDPRVAVWLEGYQACLKYEMRQLEA